MISMPPQVLSRENEVAAVAEELALRHFPEGRVEPEEIALQAGVEFCYTSFAEDIDGLLVHEEGRFTIFCNERRVSRGSPRSRFTFCHELGHHQLEWHREAVVAGQFVARGGRPTMGLDSRLEHEADVFAANLLMPEKTFRKQAAYGVPGLGLIRALATDFGTSLTCAAYRVLALDLLPPPCALFFWNQSGVCTGRRVSPLCRELIDRDTATITSPPPRSVTARHSRNRIQSGVVQALDWFPTAQAPELAGLEFKEEVMSLGAYGWVTLLMPHLE